MTLPSALPVRVAATLVALNTAAGLTLWWLQPERGWRWAVTTLAVPLLWGLIETLLGPHDGRRETAAIRDLHRWTISWGALMMLIGNAARLAIAAGLLDVADADLVQRMRGLVFGAGLLVFGNYLPKALSPWRTTDEPFDWQGVHRFVGRLFVLGGAVTVFGWITLPTREARLTSAAAMIALAFFSVGRKILSIIERSRPAASQDSPR